MDPVHFAMIGIVSLAFGLVTPPYGLCLMIACSVAGIRMRDAIKDTFIMLLPMLAVLALVIMWPQFSLFLPRLFPVGFRGGRTGEQEQLGRLQKELAAASVHRTVTTLPDSTSMPMSVNTLRAGSNSSTLCWNLMYCTSTLG
jgi:hypothetical protein